MKQRTITINPQITVEELAWKLHQMARFGVEIIGIKNGISKEHLNDEGCMRATMFIEAQTTDYRWKVVDEFESFLK